MQNLQYIHNHKNKWLLFNYGTHAHADLSLYVSSYCYHLTVVLSSTEFWDDSVVGSYDMEGTDGTHR